jgi:hypothetical protein
MATTVEPKDRNPPSPEVGVIRDAQKRQRRRRLGIGISLIAVAGLGVLLAGLTGAFGSRTRSAPHPSYLAVQRARERLGGVRISPALEGGDYGWCVTIRATGTCGGPTTQNARSITGLGGIEIDQRGDVRATALLAADVHGVLANGRAAKLIHVPAHIPYHLHLVQIELPNTGTSPATGSRSGAATSGPVTAPAPPPSVPPMPTLTAIGAGGKPVGKVTEPVATRVAIRWWEKPEALPSGPCQIRAHGLRGLTPQWGHVAVAVRPYPARIVGRAFFSCIDTEYYFHNWPLETAVLLDAEHPGRTPDPLPNIKAVAGASGFYNTPGGWNGEITATRRGDAWLAVEGGSSVTQRVEVLRHLAATVRL